MADERFRARLRSAVPVFLVSDIASTMRWYQTHLGFDAHAFPETPPYGFCVLIKDGVEIMLQRLAGYEKPNDFGKRAGGVWNAYLRIQGVVVLYEAMSKASDVKVLEPLKRQSYGDTEFVVEDPNGYVLVLSELISKPEPPR